MKRGGRTFKTLSPELRDTEQWRKVDTTLLDDQDRQRFERYMPAVKAYLSNGALRAAAKSAGVSDDSLLAQVRRCTKRHPEGGIVGWAGLIRGLRLEGYERSCPLPQGKQPARGKPGGAKGAGNAGAFRRFLDDNFPIKKSLDEVIRKGLGRGSVRAAKTTAKMVWDKFVAVVEQSIAADQYPRTTKSCARRSVERYMGEMIATDAQARATAVGAKTAKAAGQVGNGLWSFDLTSRALDLIQIDAHHEDCIGTIEVEGPAGSQFVPLSRIWIYAIACAESRAIHGYSASFRSEPVSTQIELALDMASKPWVPRNVKMEGVSYKQGAGFPMGCVEGFKFAPAAIRMDNAMQGFARRIVDRVRRRFGCAASWSAVGAWYHNAVIERFFGIMESYGLHRLPTSVGSGPSDPKKTNAVVEAVRLKVTWEELLDILDITIANYNAKGQPGLGHRSPLEVLRDLYSPERQRFAPRPLIPPTLLTPRLGVAIETHIVRGSCRPGKLKRPYVQVDKATYTNPELAADFGLIGQTLVLHVHESDMRTVEAYRQDGTYLGWLTVRERGWRRTLHTRDVRKQINRMRDARELADSGDFIEAYLEHLAAKALAAGRSNPHKVSEAATALAETARVTGAAVPRVGARKPADNLVPLRLVPIPAQLNLRRPSWG
ncbi:hypothetical protein ACS5PN_03770 [Roseateles sp. NT4]|uniref:hypothetical protein n=1 Tax=Roseateles sp. NT4 TaxID=3453715 RepID=UPI003EF04E28